MSFAINSDRPEGCLSPKEFAARAGIDLSTVHRYLKRGHLTKIQLAGKNGRIWIPERELYSQSPACTGAAPDHPDSADSTDARSSLDLLPGKRAVWMNGLHSPNTGGNYAPKKES